MMPQGISVTIADLKFLNLFIVFYQALIFEIFFDFFQSSYNQFHFLLFRF